MARKRSRISRRMLFTWFMLGALILLIAPQQMTNRLQLFFAHIFHWPLRMSRDIMLSARTSQPTIKRADRTEIQLENRNANLEAMLAEAIQRDKELTNFLREYPRPGDKFVFANITKISADELVINRGENHGLKVGQFVLGDNSIIGTVCEVTAYTSKVRLITSPRSQIAVRLGDRDAIVEGNETAMKIQLIPKSYKVKTAQKVFCKPKTGFLYSPIIIGTVSEHRESNKNPLLWEITVEPACDIETLTSVDVIVVNSVKTGR